MRVCVKVFSKIYMDQDDTSWSARPTRDLMRRLHSQDSMRWIATFDAGRISVGDHVNCMNGDALFIPAWFMETIGVEDGSEIFLDFERSEELPKATRLAFKILGDIPDGIDIRDIIEEPLSQLGVIEVGQMIPLPVLDGVMLLLTDCEPILEEGGAVFLDGAEIALDIEEDAKEHKEHKEHKESSPINTRIVDNFDEMIPPVMIPPVMIPPAIPLKKEKFVPFQGTGYRLG